MATEQESFSGGGVAHPLSIRYHTALQRYGLGGCLHTCLHFCTLQAVQAGTALVTWSIQMLRTVCGHWRYHLLHRNYEESCH
jgi:hypothetical protein